MHSDCIVILFISISQLNPEKSESEIPLICYANGISEISILIDKELFIESPSASTYKLQSAVNLIRGGFSRGPALAAEDRLKLTLPVGLLVTSCTRCQCLKLCSSSPVRTASPRPTATFAVTLPWPTCTMAESAATGIHAELGTFGIF